MTVKGFIAEICQKTGVGGSEEGNQGGGEGCSAGLSVAALFSKGDFALGRAYTLSPEPM